MKKTKFKCTGCGKEYKLERYYKLHLTKCEEYLNLKEAEKDKKEPELDKKEPEITQKTQENDNNVLDVKPESTNQQVYQWFERLNGRITGNRAEIIRMMGWYNELFKPKPIDPDCQPCVTHAFQRLRSLYLKQKNRKKQPKQGCCK